MSLLKKLAGETAIYGISNVLSRILHYLLLTPYLTRVFDGPDKDQYGIHGLMYAFAALLMVLFTYRMETAFFRFGSKDGQLGRSFSTATISLIFSTVFFVGIAIWFAEDIAALLTRASDRRFVIWFAFIIGLDALAAVPFARLRLENRPVRFAIIKIINILINAGLVLFFLEACPRLLTGGSHWLQEIYQANRALDYVFISNLIASSVVLLLLLPQFFKIQMRFDVRLWKQMFRYAWPLILVGIAGVVNQLLDRYLLKEWLPGNVDANLAQVGIYSGCVKLAVLMNLFTQAFNYAAEPFFFRHADKQGSRQIYAQVAQAFALVGSLVFLGIMLYIDVVKVMIAADYWEGLKVVPVLLLAYLGLGLYYNFSIWYKLTDHTLIGAFIALAGSAITLLVNYLLIPKIGYMGSAWAALACYTLMCGLSYIIGRRYYPVPYPLGRILAYVLAAVAVYMLSNYLRSFTDAAFWPTIAVNTVLLGVYVGIIYALEGSKLRAMLRE